MASPRVRHRLPSAEQAPFDPAAKLREISGRLSDMALTAWGIIQGVSLGILGAVVASGHEHFTVAQWLMVLCVFLILVNAWYDLMVYILSFEVVVSYREALLPFILGALEMFMAYTIPVSLGLWLWGFTGIALVALLGVVHVGMRAPELPANAFMLRATRRGRTIRLVFLAALLLVSGLGAGFATLTSLNYGSSVAVVVMAAAVVSEVLYAITGVALWRGAVRTLQSAAR